MKRQLATGLMLAMALACTKEKATEVKDNAKAAAHNVAEKARDAVDAAVPIGDRDDAAARERERFDESWRNLESFRAQQAAQKKAEQAAQQKADQAQAAQQQAAAQKIQFVTNVKESFKNLTPDVMNRAPVSVPIKGDVSGPSVVKTQVYLDRAHFSVGALDGRWGRNSSISVYWYQRTHGIEPTGTVDEATFRALAQDAGAAEALVQHTLTEDDVKGPFVTIPSDVYEKEKLDCLCYETKKEKLAELFHTTEEFLDQLNPNVDFSTLQAGQTLWVPNVRASMTADQPDIAKVAISIRGNTFNAYDASGNLIFHAPTTLGSKYDPSPNEETSVVKVVQDPHFHYQPTLFHEVPDSDPEAQLNPGPNSPVGVVWIALKKPHFGIHGTSDPDSIGYASSHGCVRLANWDAREVGHRIAPGVPIDFIDTRTAQ
ncbi:MAG TPA: L,D-transpeptidase [Thermoanaerobaculia bacterium]|nr:L,D-transpeptidase [Thermoanaerobaculia bacterium]